MPGIASYVMLLDWTGRELRADKRGAIPEHLAGPDRGAAGAQSIELGGNGARIRSAVQAGGRAIELARRCRGALLAALVSGQGGGPNGLSVGQRLDAEP